LHTENIDHIASVTYIQKKDVR